jgi:hypothetical protein
MINDQISQDEINNILWKACDTFRGTIDPSEYKNYTNEAKSQAGKLYFFLTLTGKSAADIVPQSSQ